MMANSAANQSFFKRPSFGGWSLYNDYSSDSTTSSKAAKIFGIVFGSVMGVMVIVTMLLVCCAPIIGKPKRNRMGREREQERREQAMGNGINSKGSVRGCVNLEKGLGTYQGRNANSQGNNIISNGYSPGLIPFYGMLGGSLHLQPGVAYGAVLNSSPGSIPSLGSSADTSNSSRGSNSKSMGSSTDSAGQVGTQPAYPSPTYVPK